MGSPALEGDREEGHRAEAGLGGHLDTDEPHGCSEVARALYLLINQSSDIGTWGRGCGYDSDGTLHPKQFW